MDHTPLSKPVSPGPEITWSVSPGDRYLSMETVAERLEMSVRSVRRLVASGDLRAVRIGKRALRIRERDVEAILRPIPTAGGAA